VFDEQRKGEHVDAPGDLICAPVSRLEEAANEKLGIEQGRDGGESFGSFGKGGVVGVGIEESGVVSE
jgi:hypothetical protein